MENTEKSGLSFEIISDHIMIKRMDKSLLNYGEMRVPYSLRDFFNFNELEKHDRWDVLIIYQGMEFEAALYLDNYKRMRGKLRLSKSLTTMLQQAGGRYIFPSDQQNINLEDIPLLRLEKINPKIYRADLIYPEHVRKDAQEYLLHEDKFLYGIKARFETNQAVRLEVLKLHGTRCAICGFDYETSYGSLGRGYIKIHEIASPEKKEEDLNFLHDFIPICENCHGILHRDKNKDLDITELQQIFHLREQLRRTEKAKIEP